VLLSLTAEFVRSQMIGFAMGFGGGGMSVGCQVVKFCGSAMCALGHDVLLTGWMHPDSSRPITTYVIADIKSMGSIPAASPRQE
jgi:hypothetical protein